MSDCATRFCDKVYVPSAINDLKRLENTMKKMRRVSKSLKLYNPKMRKTIRQGCIMTHCNPSCAHTIMTTAKNTSAMKRFEKESFNAMTSQSAKEKVFISSVRKAAAKLMRNTIRAKYAQPLKNGFYRGLSSADIKMLKSYGATSGCSLTLAGHLLKRR